MVLLWIDIHNATSVQATDRLHRFGQNKPVYVNRILVENTIEERILKLQAAKQELADAALAEGKFRGNKHTRLSIKDIKLVGLLCVHRPESLANRPFLFISFSICDLYSVLFLHTMSH